jgi:transcriptional regulator GlxA family with amidase domain
MSVTLDRLRTHPTRRVRTVGHGLVSSRPPLNSSNPRPTDDRRLLLVVMLIKENMRCQLEIHDLAAAVNLSPGRLAHLFKSEIGISPQRYLNSIRLEKAKECLEDGALSCKEIAAEVGIPNVSHFCRSFKALYGITPKEYRKTHLRLDLKRAERLLSSEENHNAQSNSAVNGPQTNPPAGK